MSVVLLSNLYILCTCWLVHIATAFSDRDGLMIQLNDLQEIIESQRVKLDSLYKVGGSVQYEYF